MKDGLFHEENMVSSSQDLFPMRGEKNGGSEYGFYSGRNDSSISCTSQDSLSKFKSVEPAHMAGLLADTPTTTLSIGGDLRISGRGPEEQIQGTILKLKTWSTTSNSSMQMSAVGRIADSGFEDYNSQNSKGIKRKRESMKGGRGVIVQGISDMNNGHDEQDSQGLVLCWGTAKGDSSVDNLTSNSTQFDISQDMEGDSTMMLGLSQALDHCSGSSDNFAVNFSSSRLTLNSTTEDQGTLLRLGQTSGESSILPEGRVRRGYSTMSNVGEGMHLGLAPAGNSSEMMLDTTLDGIPVVDEGSSSARMSRTGGGFMPALLMGSPINFNPNPQRQIQNRPAPEISFPELMRFREREEHAVEQDPLNAIKSSTSGGTTSTSGASGLSDRANKVCKFRGCSKGARGASGLCIAHGGGRRCEKTGCNKGAEGRTVYCKAHGGGRRCQNLGCTKSAEGKTDYCIGHGGGRRCSHEGCDKAARGRSGLCIRHGGGKRCLTEGCTKSAEGYSGLCISHGGGRRCHFSGCSKGAQGSTLFCKAHGGGKRCMIQGCNKGAEGSTPLCKGHGGGKRCMHDGGGICTKSVHGGTLYCVAHGGGKRCQVEGCSKSARGRTDFCVRHGGGKRCKIEACGKSAQGSTDFCKAHGGGKRCQWGVEGSGFGEPGKGEVCDKFARGKTGLCAAHSAQVQDRRVHGGAGLGPGLTPGLFRGLVSGSGQTNLSMGAASSGAHGMYSSSGASVNCSSSSEDRPVHSNTGLSGHLFSKPISGKGSNISLNTSAITNVGLGNTSSHGVGLSVDHLSPSTTGLDLQRSSPPSSGTSSVSISFSIGHPLIPPQVLVPLSMKKDLGFSRPNHGRPPRPPLPTSDEGVLTMSSLSSAADGSGHGGALPEGRVHGGGLMALLARDVRSVGAGLDSISLGMTRSSQPMDVRWSRSAGGGVESSMSQSMEGGLQRQKRGGSLGADVGQFLAARVNLS